MKTEELRKEAANALSRKAESFERCDTDGFVSQWASGLNADLKLTQAEIIENGGLAEFLGLYEGNRRVKAKLISTKFGTCWLLHDDEIEIIEKRGKKFLPSGKKSRILKELDLSIKKEKAKAYAFIGGGTGTGLSGAASCRVIIGRDKSTEWGEGSVTL